MYARRASYSRKKIEYSFELDNPWDEKSRVADANPLGKVRCCAGGRQHAVRFARYRGIPRQRVSDQPPDSRQQPRKNRGQALEALADGVLDAAVTVVLERRARPN